MLSNVNWNIVACVVEFAIDSTQTIDGFAAKSQNAKLEDEGHLFYEDVFYPQVDRSL